VEDSREYFAQMADMLGRVQVAGRFSMDVEFAYPVREVDWPKGEQTREQVVEQEARKIIDDAGPFPDEVEFQSRPASIGRGAEGLGIALQVVTVALQVTGGVVGLVEFAKLVGRTWKRLFRKRPPMLSLRAVKMLCIADLAEQEGDLQGVEVLFAGDITRGPDLSHTGLDMFMVVFLKQDQSMYGIGGQLWFYVVDSYGRIVHQGQASHVPFWMLKQHPEEKPRYLLGTTEEPEEEPREENSEDGG
jgi:hypothetical protein